MKFFIPAVSFISLYSSHAITGFSGEQQSEIASPDSKINLGQLQIQKHNEVRGFPSGALYYLPQVPLTRFNTFNVVPVYHGGFERFGGYNVLPGYKGHHTKLYSPIAGTVASPSHTISVGSLFNNNQGAISKE
ncbi:hypothetical protein K502DRAFT_365846 [Neoconidiobolus thromboides FSU 785]|nr:hypothetical protein K502DRAFT_365846 [Neoconidiobolus thromboides FSU 785]